MLLEAQDKWQIDLKKSFMIGDRFSDVTAGRTAGTKTILIGEGDEDISNESPDYRFISLIEAYRFIENL